MTLQELKQLSEKENIYLFSSEQEELKGPEYEDEFYNQLRQVGFYRVFATYFKDMYQCTQFYCTAFLNSESGYEWLISATEEHYIDDDYETLDLDATIFDLYLVTKNDNKWNRKDKKMFTGTAKELLEYSKEKDKQDYKIANRWNKRGD